MGIRKLKPTSPGVRFQTIADFSELTKGAKPTKSLLKPRKRKAGRNNNGRITTRHKGGGHKRKMRIIDFKRDKLGIPATVKSIEYDPNRSARLALLFYKDGEKRYILWPKDLKVGDEVLSGPESEIRAGNALPMEKIPLGTLIHNIEMKVGKGGQMARCGGTYAQLMAKEAGYATLRLPSNEMRRVPIGCYATVGQLGNVDHENIVVGKAGRKRWKGVRPTVRGVVMNPVDHPHGGGEGKAGQGNPHPVTPWGVPTKGYRTRKRNKLSNKWIVRRRKGK